MPVSLVTVEVLNFVRIYDSIKEKEVRIGPGHKSSILDTIRAIDYSNSSDNPWNGILKKYMVEIELNNSCFNRMYLLAESAKNSAAERKQNLSEFLNNIEEIVKQNA